jgi:hypothetical protein
MLQRRLVEMESKERGREHLEHSLKRESERNQRLEAQIKVYEKDERPRKRSRNGTRSKLLLCPHI